MHHDFNMKKYSSKHIWKNKTNKREFEEKHNIQKFKHLFNTFTYVQELIMLIINPFKIFSYFEQPMLILSLFATSI